MRTYKRGSRVGWLLKPRCISLWGILFLMGFPITSADSMLAGDREGKFQALGEVVKDGDEVFGVHCKGSEKANKQVYENEKLGVILWDESGPAKKQRVRGSLGLGQENRQRSICTMREQ